MSSQDKNCSALDFVKAQGAGNDFVIIDGVTKAVQLNDLEIRQIADRRLGIGCDQVLLVEPPATAETDFQVRFYNADGSEIGQCGNGICCLGRFILERGLAPGRRLRLQTLNAVVETEALESGRMRAMLGIPSLEPSALPFAAATKAIFHQLQVEDEEQEISVVFIGNPHAVLLVTSSAAAPVAELGALIAVHERFPEGANVGFLEVLGRDSVRLRVFERGVGETPACGSGACAAVIAGRLRGLLDKRVQVAMPGGDLQVEWDGEGLPVSLEGDTNFVFSGRLNRAALPHAARTTS